MDEPTIEPSGPAWEAWHDAWLAATTPQHYRVPGMRETWGQQVGVYRRPRSGYELAPRRPALLEAFVAWLHDLAAQRQALLNPTVTTSDMVTMQDGEMIAHDQLLATLMSDALRLGLMVPLVQAIAPRADDLFLPAPSPSVPEAPDARAGSAGPSSGTPESSPNPPVLGDHLPIGLVMVLMVQAAVGESPFDALPTPVPERLRWLLNDPLAQPLWQRWSAFSRDAEPGTMAMIEPMVHHLLGHALMEAALAPAMLSDVQVLIQRLGTPLAWGERVSTGWPRLGHEATRGFIEHPRSTTVPLTPALYDAMPLVFWQGLRRAVLSGEPRLAHGAPIGRWLVDQALRSVAPATIGPDHPAARSTAITAWLTLDQDEWRAVEQAQPGLLRHHMEALAHRSASMGLTHAGDLAVTVQQPQAAWARPVLEQAWGRPLTPQDLGKFGPLWTWLFAQDANRGMAEATALRPQRVLGVLHGLMAVFEGQQLRTMLDSLPAGTLASGEPSGPTGFPNRRRL